MSKENKSQNPLESCFKFNDDDMGTYLGIVVAIPIDAAVVAASLAITYGKTPPEVALWGLGGFGAGVILAFLYGITLD